ncbi:MULTISPECIES: 2-oxo-4-hydroxy-4-carboxy-5-ureidoimidazoline decarboxylase [Micromonospora]|uniref:2-oxo-4-hydroxy-4-carboxy-5-ureidoimidazoline decarboxylase n=1 Tax=Micromonospora haikouensis TaxID=686309 RepID=A0A1C4WQE9_9ACTN|nr:MULTISPECIES: 2-oxo-4-hydroxy-4-carboxy-5-ureidoimidazoline decarboxylase [Micromonospora]SCE98516.1 2-oxo-4-hydroxy-4-carboxy-5-ureidoimidazoline decarboxylase [Micromonospora haikouensis]
MTRIEEFNALAAQRAEDDLLACCAVPRWAREVAAGRPYPDLAALLAAAHAASAGLTWPEVAQALAAHPRIGQRPAGQRREDGWSRGEQSGLDAASARSRADIAEANEAYERRFGHLFLVCAAGRSDAELLAAARDRLAHDEATEREVVRGELAKIAALRIRKLLDGPA